jgi:hypothetical protein
MNLVNTKGAVRRKAERQCLKRYQFAVQEGHQKLLVRGMYAEMVIT